MDIFLSTKAEKQLRKLPHGMHNLIISHIKALGKETYPEKATKLVSRPGWRLRVGHYRILYIVDAKKQELIILSVAHRKDAYRM